jgi:hypothetical protein
MRCNSSCGITVRSLVGRSYGVSRVSGRVVMSVTPFPCVMASVCCRLSFPPWVVTLACAFVVDSILVCGDRGLYGHPC